MLLPLLLFACLVAGTPARADLGVVLADPTTVGASVYTHAGHSLVYLSGVCAASPVAARLCRPGEQGSIVTTYPDFRESRDYSFNLAPLSLYLYGAQAPGQRLLYASAPVKQALESHAREGFLHEACTGSACPTLPHSYWRDMVAETASRDIFIFAVHTTPAQDQAVVDWLNSRPNVNRYRPLTNNCANFTSELVNTIFPHSVHRDYLNDLGMMGPKAAARSFSHWAVKHPQLGFHTMHFAQQPGDLPRSGIAQSGTETAIHMKKYLIPAALIGDHEVAGSFFVAYFFTGRFNVYKEYSRYPAPSIVMEEREAKSARAEGDRSGWSSLEASLSRSRAGVNGEPSAWAGFRSQFAAIESEAEAHTCAPRGKLLFPQPWAKAAVQVDADGLPWLVVDDESSTRRVGISTANLLAPGSDPSLAFQLMLARVAYALRARNHMRETLEEFHQDWSLLEQARDLVAAQAHGNLSAQAEGRPAGQADQFLPGAIPSPAAPSVHDGPQPPASPPSRQSSATAPGLQ